MDITFYDSEQRKVLHREPNAFYSPTYQGQRLHIKSLGIVQVLSITIDYETQTLDVIIAII